METFSSIFKSLFEAGTSHEPIEWNKSSTKWEGSFSVRNQSFNIVILKNGNYCDNVAIWEFKFTRDGVTKMFNDGLYSFAVVPTIRKATRDFLSEVDVDVFAFIGNNKDRGRVKIYNSEAMRLSDEFKYKMNINLEEGDYATFVLYKSNNFLDCVEAIRKMKYSEEK